MAVTIAPPSGGRMTVGSGVGDCAQAAPTVKERMIDVRRKEAA